MNVETTNKLYVTGMHENDKFISTLSIIPSAYIGTSLLIMDR